MPIIVSATGPDALPATQEEVDERRQARLDKKAATISKKRKRASVTEGLTNIQMLGSALERNVTDLVGPGTPPLGQPPGLTPARASLPRGLTPDPGAAHGGEDGPHPGPHPPTPGTAHGGNDPKQGSCSRWKGE